MIVLLRFLSIYKKYY